MLSLPLWVQWTAAVVFTVVNIGTIAWVVFVMWPWIRWSRRMTEESNARIKDLVDTLKKKLDKPKITEIDIP